MRLADYMGMLSAFIEEHGEKLTNDTKVFVEVESWCDSDHDPMLCEATHICLKEYFDETVIVISTIEKGA